MQGDQKQPSFPDWDPVDFDVQSWIYSADISGLSVDNFCNIWVIADFLLIETLKEACLEYISEQSLNFDQLLKVLAQFESSSKRLKVSDTCHKCV